MIQSSPSPSSFSYKIHLIMIYCINSSFILLFFLFILFIFIFIFIFIFLFLLLFFRIFSEFFFRCRRSTSWSLTRYLYNTICKLSLQYNDNNCTCTIHWSWFCFSHGIETAIWMSCKSWWNRILQENSSLIRSSFLDVFNLHCIACFDCTWQVL